MSSQNDQALIDRLGVVGTLDRAIFGVETVIVVTALIVMSVLVFTDVVYQLMVSVQQGLDASDGQAYTLLGVLLVFIGAMAWAASAPLQSLAKRLRVLIGTVAVTIVFSYAITVWESSTVYRFLLVALAIPAALTMWSLNRRVALGVFLVSTSLAFWVFGSLPTGYSWSQSYSLLLLLWVGFLGASMAARQRRHLKIDLARKLLPASKVAAFNAVSYFAAATFSGIVFYLSYIYMFGPDSTYLAPIWEAPTWLPQSMQEELTSGFPLPEDASFLRRFMQVIFAPGEPGEVPDWLKVLAIPVSFFLITARFLGHTVVFATMALRKEVFIESVEAH